MGLLKFNHIPKIVGKILYVRPILFVRFSKGLMQAKYQDVATLSSLLMWVATWVGTYLHNWEERPPSSTCPHPLLVFHAQ